MKTPSLSALLLLLCLAPVAVWGDDDDDDDDDDRRPARAAVAPLPLTAERAQYEAECGSCHMAYAPGMLPARSWTKMLAGLDAHFGQNAELDAATVRTLSAWLAPTRPRRARTPCRRRS
jgi:cytochrome c553